MTGIYQITNVENGKIYIGQSQDIERRFHDHKNSPQPKMREDVEIFGWDSFKFEVLEECSLEVLNDRENFYIEKLNPEYNTIKLHNWTHTPETCEKIRQAKLGSHHTEKACEKMSESRKGVTLSEEHKEKCRQKSIGNKSRSRPVICVETGIEYENAKTAAQAVGLKSSSAISSVLRGVNVTAKGYHWEYADDKNGVERRNKSVICVETNEIFPTIQAAADHTGESPTVISRVLKGKVISAGYHWRYADEDNQNFVVDREKRRDKRFGSNSHYIPIICIETGEAFESIKIAAEHFGISKQSISAMLNGRSNTAGGFRFKYVDGLSHKKVSKKVQCLETGEIFENSRVAAEHIGLSYRTMENHLRGYKKSCGGLHWKYF